MYHCVDEFSAFSDAGAEVAARERELLSARRMSSCVPRLGCTNSKKAHNRHTYLVTHGVDYEFFRKATCAMTSSRAGVAEAAETYFGIHWFAGRLGRLGSAGGPCETAAGVVDCADWPLRC